MDTPSPSPALVPGRTPPAHQQHPDLRATRYIPTKLTKLVQALPPDRRARFFRQAVVPAVPEPHRQRFMVRGLLPLLMPFLLDVDAYVFMQRLQAACPSSA